MGTSIDRCLLACDQHTFVDTWTTAVTCIGWWCVVTHERGQRSLTLMGWFHEVHSENNGCLSFWFLKLFLYSAAELRQDGEHVPQPWPHSGPTTGQNSSREPETLVRGMKGNEGSSGWNQQTRYESESESDSVMKYRTSLGLIRFKCQKKRDCECADLGEENSICILKMYFVIRKS